MKPSQRTTWIGLPIIAGLALACGGEPGFDNAAVEVADEASAESIRTEASLDGVAATGGEVTSREMAMLEEYFERSSSGAPTEINGRQLHWGDAMLTVDDVIDRIERMDEPTSIEKSYAETSAFNPGSGNSFQFWRPDVGPKYFIIVDDGVDAGVFNAVGQAAAEWSGLVADCTGTGLFQAIRRTAYFALPASTRDINYVIAVRYIPRTDPGWFCASGQRACADFPALVPIKVSGQVTQRMAFGDRVLLDSSFYPTTDIPMIKRVLLHEFGHTLGFDHQSSATAPRTHLIPGTSSCGSTCGQKYASVMRDENNTVGIFSDDDRKAMRTLYANESNRANDDCTYVDDFRNLTGLP